MGFPETQKAWMIMKSGPPHIALANMNIPVVQVSQGKVLIKVEAVGLNEWAFNHLSALSRFVSMRPRVAEFEFSGIVVDGTNTRYKAGDTVFGLIDPTSSDGSGALTEYVVAEEDDLALKPDYLPFIEAAGLSFAGQTAWQALDGIAKVQDGQRVFVNGGNTPTGMIAVQLLKARQCWIETSCFSDDTALLRQYGAKNVFNRPTDLAQQLADRDVTYDVIFDFVGGDWRLYYQSAKYLVAGGIFISTGIGASNASNLARYFYTKLPFWITGFSHPFHSFKLTPTFEAQQALSRLAIQIDIKVPIDSVHRFDDAIAAYEHLGEYKTRGKVIIVVSDNHKLRNSAWYELTHGR